MQNKFICLSVRVEKKWCILIFQKKKKIKKIEYIVCDIQ